MRNADQVGDLLLLQTRRARVLSHSKPRNRNSDSFFHLRVRPHPSSHTQTQNAKEKKTNNAPSLHRRIPRIRKAFLPFPGPKRQLQLNCQPGFKLSFQPSCYANSLLTSHMYSSSCTVARLRTGLVTVWSLRGRVYRFISVDLSTPTEEG